MEHHNQRLLYLFTSSYVSSFLLNNAPPKLCPTGQAHLSFASQGLFQVENQNPFQFYAHIVKFGFDSDQFVRNSLISASANCGHVEFARQVFGESKHNDVVAWTAMIDWYVRHGSVVDALDCFMDMRSMGVKVDEVTVVSVFSAVGMVGDIWFSSGYMGFI